MFKKIRAKLEQFADKKMVIPELYDKLKTATPLEIYDETIHYMLSNKLGQGYNKEAYTTRKIVKERGLISQDMIDARDARQVMEQLIYEQKKKKNPLLLDLDRFI